MKRKIFIIMFAAATALSLYGCSKADIEKNPVTIEDFNTNLNATVLDEEINDNEKQSTELTDKTLNENSTTDNADNTADSETSSETESKINAAKLELEGKEVDLKVEIEGSTEIVKGKIHVSETGYQMAYDPERYEFYRQLDDVDNYKAKNEDLYVYPYVFLNVSRFKNTTMKDYAKQIEKDVRDKIVKFEMREYAYIGEEQYKTIHIRAQSGNKWDSTVREYYILQDDNDIILVEAQYYLEAEEGHSARFSAMLDTFKLL